MSKVPRISTLKAKELLQEGCTRYLAYVVDTVKTEIVGLGETRVVCEFTNVFLDSFPGLPPQLDV